jgi:putative effector of murein hydrolase
VQVISPLLFVQVINLVIYDVLYNLPFRQQALINFDAYYLAYTMIIGFTSVATIHLFQALYKQDEKIVEKPWPLVERDAERLRE